MVKRIELERDRFLAHLTSKSLAAGGESVECCLKAVEVNPENEGAHYRLAVAYARAGDLEAALESSAQAIRIQPDFAEAYLLRGLVYEQKGELELAHEDIATAVLLKPELYDERFEPIMESIREEEAEWDELTSRPEAKALFEKWEAEAMEEYRAGKTKPLDPEDL